MRLARRTLITILLGSLAAMTLPAAHAEDRATAARALPHVVVLATGGTIAGRQDDKGQGGESGRAYHASGVDVSRLIAAAPGLESLATLSGEQVASIGSQDMHLAVWRQLVARVRAALDDPRVDGVVITHGTDTLEETAFLLDLVVDAVKPVVLVGAMRPSDALSADGPGNLVEAVRTAIDPASRGRGMLVVLNDRIHAARGVRKAQTTGVDAFRSYPGGAVGMVDSGGARYFAGATLSALRGKLALPANGQLPSVPIVYGHADMDIAATARMLDGAAGIVLAGVGNGNAPAALLDLLAKAAARGVTVVRSTRVGEGFVDRNVEVDDDLYGFVAARDLSPQKSRILLQLLLAARRTDRQAVQQAFDDR